ncbi:MAG: DUF2306 domain-containing protein [Thiotrichales bacterium]|nr:DUF2306 domain-containing protein [Thiotrichales bacterium]
MTYLHLAYLHLGTVVPAFFLGTYLLINRKGTPVHKMLGKIYMVLMLLTASITLFMSAEVGPTFLSHFGFIHFFSFLVLYSVPAAFFAARKGHIKSHRGNMLGVYFGGILIAGGFAFTPGRLLHTWLIA